MRVINRVFNNNVVSAVGADGHEVILVGSGLGYLAKRGGVADEDRVEREFHPTGLVGEGAFRVLLELPTPVLGAVTRITGEIRDRHGYRFGPAAEVALADHIAQAVARAHQGLHLSNPMLWETKANYPQEFALAEQAIAIIASVLDVSLPDDEAGFIALHFVNAGVCNESRRVLSQSAALRGVLDIVQEDLGITLHGDSPATRRFLVHLKFVIERVTAARPHTGEPNPIFESLRETHDREFACARRITAYLEHELTADLTQEETFYLMLHLIRLCDAFDPGRRDREYTERS